MLIGIIADLHSNIEATQAVLKALDEIGPDQIYCLGDIVGYNTNPNEVVEIIRERQIPRIMGNHDAIVSGLEKPTIYSSKALAALEWHDKMISDDNRQWLAEAPARVPFERICLGVHGAPGDRDLYILDWMDAMQQFMLLDGTGITVCFFGHTHRASLFGEHSHVSTTIKKNRCRLNPANRYLINPGAVGQPRDGDPRAAFGLLDTEKLVFEFHRVDYDIASTARKVIDAGLPKQIAGRLFKGK